MHGLLDGFPLIPEFGLKHGQGILLDGKEFGRARSNAGVLHAQFRACQKEFSTTVFIQAPQAMDGLSRAEKAVKANVHVDRIGEGASQNATGPCHHFIEDSRDDTPVNGMTESGMSNFRNPLSMDGLTIGFHAKGHACGIPMSAAEARLCLW